MKIRFLRDAQVESEGRHKGPVFKAGPTYDLPDPSAQRWLRRGVAVEVAAEVPRVRPERPMMIARAPDEAPEPEAKPEEAPASKPKRRGRRGA